MSAKIMIVDDSTTIRKIVGIVLEKENYQFIEAKNGVDALEKIKTEKIGLIICDINMPEMDGITFLKKAKENEMSKHTPFIMLTTEAGDAKIAEGKKAGAKAWLIKPFKPEQLIDTIKKLIVVE
jgi:two-component system, chemotaxis family, chemotaxis protein CheY